GESRQTLRRRLSRWLGPSPHEYPSSFPLIRKVTAHTMVFEARRNGGVGIKEVPPVDDDRHIHNLVHGGEIQFPELAPFRQQQYCVGSACSLASRMAIGNLPRCLGENTLRVRHRLRIVKP